MCVNNSCIKKSDGLGCKMHSELNFGCEEN